MKSWWFVTILTFGLFSILTLSPIPLAIVFVGWLVGQIFERPLVAQIEEAGQNPELPPMPTSGIGCAGFLVYAIAWAMALLLLVGVIGLLVTEGVGM